MSEPVSVPRLSDLVRKITGSHILPPVDIDIEPSLTVPAPNAVLTGAEVTFQGNAGSRDVTLWWLYIGSTLGGVQHYDSGARASATFPATGIPTDGSTVYARLFWRRSDTGTTWHQADFTYTAADVSDAVIAPNQIFQAYDNWPVNEIIGVLDVDNETDVTESSGLINIAKEGDDWVIRVAGTLPTGEQTISIHADGGAGDDEDIVIDVGDGLAKPVMAPITVAIQSDIEDGHVLYQFDDQNLTEPNPDLAYSVPAVDDGNAIQGVANGHVLAMQAGLAITLDLANKRIIVPDASAALSQHGTTDFTFWLSASNVIGRNAGGSLDPQTAVTASVDMVGVAPVNTTAPVVSGTRQRTQTITVDSGEWDNSPTSFSYSLKRDGVEISTGTSYTLVADDVGAVLVWDVTATNSVDSTTVSVSVGAISDLASDPVFSLANAITFDNVTATSARAAINPVDAQGNPINTVVNPVEWSLVSDFSSGVNTAPAYTIAHPSHQYTVENLPDGEVVYLRYTITGPDANGNDGQGNELVVTASVDLLGNPGGDPPSGDIYFVMDEVTAPPAMANPNVVQVTAGSMEAAVWADFPQGCTGTHYRMNLDDNQDYILVFNDKENFPAKANFSIDGGLHINGGRNVRIIGPDIDVTQSCPAGYQAGAPFPVVPSRRVFHAAQVEKTFIEGAKFLGNYLEADMIVVRNSGSTAGSNWANAHALRKFYLLNSFCRGAEGWDNGEHGDIMQIQGEDVLGLLHMENCKLMASYEGFVMEAKPDTSGGADKRWHGVKHVQIKDLHLEFDTSAPSDNIWYTFLGFECQTRTINDLWVDHTGSHNQGNWSASGGNSGFHFRVVPGAPPVTGFWTGGPGAGDSLDFSSAEALANNWNFRTSNGAWQGAGVVAPAIAPESETGINYYSPF